MWHKKTPVELAEDRRKLKRDRLTRSIAIGLVTFILALVTKGWHSVYQGGDFFASYDEMPRRLVGALIFGAVVGLLFYNFWQKSKTIVCSSCGKTGYAGSTSRCSCGGHFESMDAVSYTHLTLPT